MLLNDHQITALCTSTDRPMIDPFVPHQITRIERLERSERVISYGKSTVGYDIRLDREIRMFRQPQNFPVVPGEIRIIDPKNFDPELVYTLELDPKTNFFVMPPHSYCLGNSMERFDMPQTIAGVCITKSTYARCGLLVNVTPLEPGWQGWLTLELANLTPLPLKVYVEEGIAQIMFHRVDEPETSYADRAGKYQNQERTPVLPRTKD